MVLPDGETSTSTFDEFGRLKQFNPPSATLVESTGAGNTQFSYSDQAYGEFNWSIENTSDGVVRSAYTYFDGFGRPIEIVRSADPSEPSGWFADGFVIRDANGFVTRSYQPWYPTTAPTASTPFRLSITAPPSASRVLSYDAFERLEQIVDFDGTVTSVVARHGLSEEFEDAENIEANTTSTHTNASTLRTRDGHGRVSSVTFTGNGGSIKTQLTYLPTGEVTSVSRAGQR